MSFQVIIMSLRFVYVVIFPKKYLKKNPCSGILEPSSGSNGTTFKVKPMKTKRPVSLPSKPDHNCLVIPATAELQPEDGAVGLPEALPPGG